MLVSSLALSACGAAPRTDAQANRAALTTCAVKETGRRALTVSGRATYVEPQLVRSVSAGLLLAGSPVFEWDTVGPGDATYERDRILGVLVAEDSVAEIARPPGLGPIGSLRGADFGADRSIWLFEDVTTTDYSEMEPLGVSWAARTAGGWSPVRRLAVSTQDGAFFSGSSRIAVHDGGLEWRLPVRLAPETVHRFRFEDTAWRRVTVDTVRAEATGLAATPSGLWEIETGPDSSFEYRRTLRVRRRGMGGHWDRVYEAGEGERIVQPLVASEGGRVSIVWRSIRGSAPVRALAVTWQGTAPSDAVTRTVAPGDVAHVVPLELPGRVSLFPVHHADPDSGSEELRLYGRVGSGPVTLLHASAHPFLGYFSAAVTGREGLTIVGPQIHLDPTRPSVRSLLIRYRLTCR